MEKSYWMRNRVARRRFIRGAGVIGTGAIGAALIGCGDDDEEVAAPAAPAAPAAAAPKAAATAAPKAAATAAPKAAAPKPTASTKPAAGQIDSNAHLRVGFGSFASSLDISTAEGAGGQAATNTYTYGNLLAANPDAGVPAVALILASVLSFAAIYFFKRWRKISQTHQLMLDTKPCPITAISEGPCEFLGKIGNVAPPLVSPWSQKACVYYDFNVEEYRSLRRGGRLFVSF